MLERTKDNFYTRTEAFTDEASRLEIQDTIKAGVRVAFDLANGQVILTETAFSNADAFSCGAVAVPNSERTFVISGDDFDNLMSAELLKLLKDLFGAAAELSAQNALLQANAEKAAKRARMELLKDEIEKVGGKVTFPDEQETENKKDG